MNSFFSPAPVALNSIIHQSKKSPERERSGDIFEVMLFRDHRSYKRDHARLPRLFILLLRIGMAGGTARTAGAVAPAARFALLFSDKVKDYRQDNDADRCDGDRHRYGGPRRG